MLDEVGSFVAAADLLHESGAYKIYVIATHGLLSLNAPQLIEDSHIDEVKLLINSLKTVITEKCYRLYWSNLPYKSDALLKRFP